VKLFTVGVLALGLLAGCAKPQQKLDRPLLNDRQKPVTAARWVRSACTVLAKAERVNQSSLGPDRTPDVEEESGREALRDELAEDLAKRRDQVAALVTELHDAGVPTSTGGPARAQSLERALTDLSRGYDRAARALRGVDVGDLATFQSDLQGALALYEGAGAAVGKARDALFEDPTLQDLLVGTTACHGR
jgi:hypothetical protein